MIVVLNMILKFSTEGMIKDMKVDSRSEEKIYAMFAVTLTQFVNTGFVLFAREVFLSLGTGLSSMEHDNKKSISVLFYATHGLTLFSAMLITAIWPLLEIAVTASMFYFLRYADRGFSRNRYVSYMPSV